jgi:hypothetical protein
MISAIGRGDVAECHEIGYTLDMSAVVSIPKTYDEAVRALALWQSDAGGDDLRVFTAEDIGDNVVRLIDVSEDFPDVGNVPVYRMGASDEFPFRTAVALARPDQWNKIKSGQGDVVLPADFKIAQAQQVWPPLAE